MAKTLEQHLAADGAPKRILALDGGGVKGILTLGMLRALEEELRERSGDPRLTLSDYYDLIGGTSTGAIIASGLALGLTINQLTELYLDLGPEVFGKQAGDGIFIQSKFDAKKLRKALTQVLSTLTLGTDRLKTGLAIHAKRIDTGSAWVLTNNPRAKYYDPPADSKTYANKRYRLIDLVLASAAAPTFFDEVVINIEYDEKDRVTQKGYFLDGAVSANNNPSMSLLMLALVPAYGFNWRSGADQLMMTSCGTGMRRPTLDGKSFQGLPPGVRGVNALRSMIYDTQVQGVMLMQALSNPRIPWVINREIGGMENVVITGGPLLDYQRMDVRLDRKEKPKRNAPAKEKKDWLEFERLIDREIDWRMCEGLDELANGKKDNMALLLEIGECVGKQYIKAEYPDPKFDLPEWKRASA